ncbi:transcription initiation factor IIB [Clavulina sp. PMI_390]|nr:transcription initiation factor IIB [Clavulina sp. PMI_390]
MSVIPQTAPSTLMAPSAPYIPPTGTRDLAVRLICPECQDPNPKIIESFASGDLVCGDCGIVLGDRIVDTRSEWRTFANDEGDDPSRVGATANPLLDGMEQLDTTIGFRDGNTGVARELQRAAARASGVKAERNLLSAFREIQNKCEAIGLTKNIGDMAKQLYKRTDEEKILRGKSVDAIIACCIFIACRQGNAPRTFREICEYTQVPKKTLGQCFKTIESAFNLTPRGPIDGLAQGGGSNTASTGASAEDLLTRYCNWLKLHPSVQGVCRDVILNARQHGIALGRSPVSIAGGAILFTTLLLGTPKTAKEISAVAGVSESTIKLVYRLFFAAKDQLVNKEWIDNGKAEMSRLTVVEPVKSSVPSGANTPSAGTDSAPGTPLAQKVALPAEGAPTPASSNTPSTSTPGAA